MLIVIVAMIMTTTVAMIMIGVEESSVYKLEDMICVPQANKIKVFTYVRSLTPIKPMYVPLPISFLPLIHAVTNVRYSVNCKHHKRYWQVPGMYRRIIILVNFL